MVDFSQKEDDEGEPVPRQPIPDAGFVAHEQGFKAVEPGVGVLDHDAAAVQFGVEGGVVVGLPVGGAAVAGDVGLHVAPGAFLAKRIGVEGFVRVQKQPGDGNIRRFKRGADFPKQSVEQVAVVVVARLRAACGLATARGWPRLSARKRAVVVRAFLRA